MKSVPLFEVDAVSKAFQLRSPMFPWMKGTHDLMAVRDVSLEIFEGDVFGIIGESGSGKSTLGFVLADIEPPSRGVVRFRGRPVGEMNSLERRKFRRKVQTIFQDSGSALNPRRKIGAVLRDSLKLSGREHPRYEEAVAELLTSVGLNEKHAYRYPHQLSGGQRQRVGIARALAMEPEVLIADEPASALDVSLQGQIINLLLGLRRRLNLTVVLISHDIALVQHASDRLVVMREGAVVEAGIASDVIASPCHAYTQALVSAVPKGFDLQSRGLDG